MAHTLDANGKYNDNIYARINLMAQDIDTADRDNVNATRWGVAPSITAKLNDKTTATLSYYYQHEESVPDYGVPYYPAPVVSTALGTFGQPQGGYFGNGAAVPRRSMCRVTPGTAVTNGPYKDQVTTDTNMVTLQLQYELNDYVTLTNGTRYHRERSSGPRDAPRALGTSANVSFASPLPASILYYPTGAMTIGMQRFQTETDNTQFTNITDMVAKFKWGQFEHTLNAGIEVTSEGRYSSVITSAIRRW